MNKMDKTEHQSGENQILNWAIRLQAIAQNGLAYTENIYDIERFTQLREISAEMIQRCTDVSLDKVRKVFCFEKGYQTPKLDTRAAIFRDDKVLLVQENTGKWAMPGGWVDVYESVRESVAKEAFEEAGLTVVPERIVAVQDRDKNNSLTYIYKICKIFVLCKEIGGTFRPNSETLSSNYFSLQSLPPLAEEKTTEKQIYLCYAASQDPNWQVQFD